MATFEFSDGFDAVGWYMDHPSAMDGDYYPDYSDEPEDDEEMDRDYWEGMAEDALMESYLGLDC